MFSKKKRLKQSYKFKYLKSYATNQTNAGNKKFRIVFEKSELTYVAAELSFFNKLFDEKDWEVEIKFAVRKIDGDTSEIIHEDTTEVTISKEDNISNHVMGWGNQDQGVYWERGEYAWDAYIGGEYIASTTFYVEYEGTLGKYSNPYLSAVRLRTYESPSGYLEEEKRVYYKTFDEKATRFIMGEFTFENKVPRDWHLELFLKTYDDTGLLIGTSDLLLNVFPEENVDKEEFTVTAGIGSDTPDNWRKDDYTLEVVFMNTVIAVIPFIVGDENVARLSDYEALLNEEVSSIFEDTLEIKKSNEELKPQQVAEEVIVQTPPEEVEDDEEKEKRIKQERDDRPLEEIMGELESLIGLGSIKAKIKEYVGYIQFLQVRKKAGILDEEDLSLHSVFTGNPGTGKTTVVKLLGRIYQSLGLLSKGHVHTVEASDLISGYIRHTGKDTKKEIEKARGGILFIDEAYMLFKKGSENDYGPEAIAALITEMSDGEGDIAIMVAGYPKEMETFISSNPGLKSRFRNYFHFQDYTPVELLEIGKFAAKKKQVHVSASASKRLKQILTEAFRKRDRTFGNARFANALIDEAKINMGIRLMKDPDLKKLTRKQLSTLKSADIEDIRVNSMDKHLKLEIDEALLKEALAELKQLTGLDAMKQEVRELVKLSRYYKENNRDILKAFSMHTIFMGNPGTGKTTVARIMAKIYKALGMLERGHLIDADGSDLVAGFVGQTSIKTKELIEQAMGGVLFIDEAYAITEGNNFGFGKKAIAALVKEMEDHRSEFGLIVAGYTQNMEHFLKSNPGLMSRFDQRFYFEDFTESELWEIAENMYKAQGLTVTPKAKEHLLVYLNFLYTTKDRFFGNARSVRKIVEKTSRNQKLRMANLEKSKRTKKMMATLQVWDVQGFVPGKGVLRKNRMVGFGK